jgi:hypothetical protein
MASNPKQLKGRLNPDILTWVECYEGDDEVGECIDVFTNSVNCQDFLRKALLQRCGGDKVAEKTVNNDLDAGKQYLPRKEQDGD